MIDKPPEILVSYHAEYQDTFGEIQNLVPEIKFVQGLPDDILHCASVCVYLYVLVLQTIQVYRTFYVFDRFACDLSFEPVEISNFSTDLYSRKQTCRIFCVSYLFECNANVLINSYFY